MLRESGLAGSAGASVAVDVPVGVATVAVLTLLGTAADDVAPAPARSQGLGGEPPVAMLRSLSRRRATPEVAPVAIYCSRLDRCQMARSVAVTCRALG